MPVGLDAKDSSVELHEFVSEKLAPVSGVGLPSQAMTMLSSTSIGPSCIDDHQKKQLVNRHRVPCPAPGTHRNHSKTGLPPTSSPPDKFCLCSAA